LHGRAAWGKGVRCESSLRQGSSNKNTELYGQVVEEVSPVNL
jgi:hypothetical protein